jgi:hypothetical protein
VTVTGLRPAERGRAGRVPRRRPADHGGHDYGGYGAYVDGANALQIGYGEGEFDPAHEGKLTPQPSAPRRGSAGRGSGVGRNGQRPREVRAGAAASGPLAQTPPLPVALPRASFLVLLVAVVVAGVIGVLVINTKINENAFRLDDLRAHQAALDLQEQQLSQQLAERESPGNLAAAAKRLGLVPAGTPAFISLPDGRVVGVPQPATGQDALAAPVAEPGR